MFFHKGPRFQEGRGLGSLFSGLWKSIKPLATMGFQAGKKLLTSDTAKKLGTTALEAGKDAIKNIAVNMLEGKKNFKDVAQEQLEEAKNKIAQGLRGSGRKRKRRKELDSSSLNREETKVKRRKTYNLLLDD
jgi:hypothetical protein